MAATFSDENDRVERRRRRVECFSPDRRLRLKCDRLPSVQVHPHLPTQDPHQGCHGKFKFSWGLILIKIAFFCSFVTPLASQFLAVHLGRLEPLGIKNTIDAAAEAFGNCFSTSCNMHRTRIVIATKKDFCFRANDLNQTFSFYLDQSGVPNDWNLIDFY